MNWILKKIMSIYSVWTMILVCGIGVFTIFNDYRILETKKMLKEANIAKVIGFAYVIGGIGIFILIKALL